MAFHALVAGDAAADPGVVGPGSSRSSSGCSRRCSTRRAPSSNCAASPRRSRSPRNAQPAHPWFLLFDRAWLLSLPHGPNRLSRSRSQRLGQDVRGDARGGRGGPGGAPRLGLRGARAQRRGQDHDDPHAGHAAAPRRGQRARARPRHRRRRRRGARSGQPDRAARLGGRGPDRPREPHPDRPPARPAARGRQGPRDGASRRLRPHRGRGQAGQELLGRDAQAARHRREHRGHAGADVPRRAHDRAGPALAQPGLGHHPRAGGGRHHDPALHPVPRGGRPAGRRHRGDRPRQGDRGGHARPAQGLGGQRRAARAPARPRAAPAGRAAARPRAGQPSTWSPTRRRCRFSAPTPTAAPRRWPSCRAPASGIADFSLGQPSLDEVFLALTGRPAEDQEEKEEAAA